MLTKQTVVDQLELTRHNTLQVRIGLILLENGKEVSCAWHRTVIEPSTNIDAQMAAVNANLSQMGKDPVDAAGITRIKEVAALLPAAKLA
jgi:hypothetical protein